MACVLKTSKSYTDNHGNSGSDFYYIIDKVVIDKLNKIVTIYPKMFINSTARSEGKDPIDCGLDRKFICSGTNYDTFFAVAVLKDKDIFEQAYSFLLQYTENIDGSDVLIVGEDWESDE